MQKEFAKETPLITSGRDSSYVDRSACLTAIWRRVFLLRFSPISQVLNFQNNTSYSSEWVLVASESGFVCCNCTNVVNTLKAQGLTFTKRWLLKHTRLSHSIMVILVWLWQPQGLWLIVPFLAGRMFPCLWYTVSPLPIMRTCEVVRQVFRNWACDPV